MLHGVSYKKGCYIGQERNSFTHYRGIIRKRCMPFRLSPGGCEVTGRPSALSAIEVKTLEGPETGE